MNELTSLCPLPVGEIRGDFFVPRYQRGYRWGEDEVTKLLEDIKEYIELNEKYYLQPVVVKQLLDGRIELIDGQQRLTTILLLYQVFGKPIRYTIDYETRPKTSEFLANIVESRSNENADYYYINEAFKTIRNWFDKAGDNKDRLLTKFYLFVEEKLFIIWYQVDNESKTSAIFTRLNIGKIPLTNAELIKALIFRGEKASIKTEWAYKWDLIERKLNDERFWGFLTNKSESEYDTRIELVFDIISKKESERNPIPSYTFDYYYKILNQSNISQSNIWQEIWQKFNLLNEWFEDRDLYHKIGYLISIGEKLTKIIAVADNIDKQSFIKEIDKMIASSIKARSISEFCYDKNKIELQKLLLLFNVESSRIIKQEMQHFPFYLHKGNLWSLEHIHAQNDEGLKTQKQWQEWIDYYIKALDGLNNDEAQELKSELLEIRPKITKEDFNRLGELVYPLFNYKGEDSTSETEINSYMHSLENMSLLGQEANSTFNNAVFAVKRQRMLELDQKGMYIPICTRRVFLKYYTSTGDLAQHFWTPNDRRSYINAIKEILKSYFELKD